MPLTANELNEMVATVLAASETAAPGGFVSASDLARLIDHTLLKPEATAQQVRQLCFEARENEFASVCVNPTWVAMCHGLLAGSSVLVATVIGFPLGATLTRVKAFEAAEAIALGANEVDMVINIGSLRSGDYSFVEEDIAAVVEAAHRSDALVKVIIETSLLSDEQKIAACLLARHAGADFVKTSTGFSGGGATVADVRLMRRAVGSRVGVKASGGIRTRQDAMDMVGAGATRLGTSAGVAIVRG